MIRADFYKADGSFTGFQIEGHAGYAASGNDIVCAGVSSAVMLVINLLEGFGIQGTPEVLPDKIIYRTTSAQKETNLLIDGLQQHLLALSEEYPKHICVNMGGKSI